MTDEEFQQTSEVWRSLVATRLQSTEVSGPQRSIAELRTSLLALADRARPSIVPPQRGWSRETTTLLRQWQPTWTHELTNSPLWRATAEQFNDIRHLISTGQLDAADWRIRDIFIRCVSSARKQAHGGFQTRAYLGDRRRDSENALVMEVAADSLQGTADDLTCAGFAGGTLNPPRRRVFHRNPPADLGIHFCPTMKSPRSSGKGIGFERFH